MALFKKKQNLPRMTRDQALACVPVHNNVLSWQEDESGAISIEYTLLLRPFFFSIFKRFAPASTSAPTRKIELDRFGSWVWKMIDGKQSAADIILSFSEQHGISHQQAEQSVTAFLRELGKRGLIGLR